MNAIHADEINKILQLCQSYDMRNIDGIMKNSWLHAAQIARWDRDQAAEAVRIHFSTSTERIMPGHVTAIIKTFKPTQPSMNELRSNGTVSDRPALTAPDRQLGGLEIGGADGPPAPKAYEVNGAVERPCPTCGAEDYAPCINPGTGSMRKIPCLARLKPAPITSDADARLSDAITWFRKTCQYQRADEGEFEALVRAGKSKYAAAQGVWPKHVPS